ncbi:MAG TPA: hypothetical protein VKP59_06635 [Candidatus Thermoplasmatota archaeon]|nr:hypothetical protein [Candidatus Thermoplasmatota archaeon]
MTRIDRYEHKIKKLQEKIKHSEKKMDELTDQLIQKRISEQKFSSKKGKISHHVKELNNQVRTLHGAIVREKRRLEKND